MLVTFSTGFSAGFLLAATSYTLDRLSLWNEDSARNFAGLLIFINEFKNQARFFPEHKSTANIGLGVFGTLGALFIMLHEHHRGAPALNLPLPSFILPILGATLLAIEELNKVTVTELGLAVNGATAGFALFDLVCKPMLEPRAPEL